MASSAIVKLACALVLCIVVAAPIAEASITCGMVSGKVAPCISFLKGGPGPSGPCCAGISSLNQAAGTTPDRKAACNCLKTAARSIPGINYGKAAALPGLCRVRVPYSISPNTNCNAIH